MEYQNHLPLISYLAPASINIKRFILIRVAIFGIYTLRDTSVILNVMQSQILVYHCKFPNYLFISIFVIFLYSNKLHIFSNGNSSKTMNSISHFENQVGKLFPGTLKMVILLEQENTNIFARVFDDKTRLSQSKLWQKYSCFSCPERITTFDARRGSLSP